MTLTNGTVRRGWLTETQIQKLLAKEPSPTYYALWCVMADCGLRMAEALGLRRNDVFDDADTPTTLRIVGKGNRVRFVELTARVRLAVAGIPAQSEAPLFPICARAAQLRFRRTARLANLPPHLTPHSLRHSFATRLLAGGLPIHDLQHIMGHSSLQTTAHYLHVVDGVLGAARAILESTERIAHQRGDQLFLR